MGPHVLRAGLQNRIFLLAPITKEFHSTFMGKNSDVLLWDKHLVISVVLTLNTIHSYKIFLQSGKDCIVSFFVISPF